MADGTYKDCCCFNSDLERVKMENGKTTRVDKCLCMLNWSKLNIVSYCIPWYAYMSFDWFNLDSMLSFDTPEESTYLLQAAGWSTGETSSSFLVKGRCPVAAQQQQQKSLLMLPLAKPQPHPSYKHQASPIVAGQRRSPQVKFSRLASSVRLFVRSLYPVRYQENATGIPWQFPTWTVPHQTFPHWTFPPFGLFPTRFFPSRAFPHLDSSTPGLFPT